MRRPPQTPQERLDRFDDLLAKEAQRAEDRGDNVAAAELRRERLGIALVGFHPRRRNKTLEQKLDEAMTLVRTLRRRAKVELDTSEGT